MTATGQDAKVPHNWHQEEKKRKRLILESTDSMAHPFDLETCSTAFQAQYLTSLLLHLPSANPTHALDIPSVPVPYLSAFHLHAIRASNPKISLPTLLHVDLTPQECHRLLHNPTKEEESDLPNRSEPDAARATIDAHALSKIKPTPLERNGKEAPRQDDRYLQILVPCPILRRNREIPSFIHALRTRQLGFGVNVF
jgi:hypothetical protein